jgi:uncharacterized membrane protein
MMYSLLWQLLAVTNTFMKQLTIGIFADRHAAEEAINRLHNELHIPNEEISYIYKNTEGDVKEVDASHVSTDTPVEGAGKGAVIGGVLGAIAGIVGIAAAFPVVGPLVAGGAIASALGLTGAVGTAAAGAVVGAATGGLVGALTHLGVGEEHAQHYQDLVMAGDVLVSIHSDKDASSVFKDSGAIETQVYKVNV